MGIIAISCWQDEISAESRARLQANDVSARGFLKYHLWIFAEVHHPNFSRCRSVCQKTLHRFPWQLSWTIEVFALGRRSLIMRSHTGRNSGEEQNQNGYEAVSVRV